MALTTKEFNVDAAGFIRGTKYEAHSKKHWCYKNTKPREGFPAESHGENVYVSVVTGWVPRGQSFPLGKDIDPISGRPR